jgi:hypothetical protein
MGGHEVLDRGPYHRTVVVDHEGGLQGKPGLQERLPDGGSVGVDGAAAQELGADVEEGDLGHFFSISGQCDIRQNRSGAQIVLGHEEDWMSTPFHFASEISQGLVWKMDAI